MTTEELEDRPARITKEAIEQAKSLSNDSVYLIFMDDVWTDGMTRQYLAERLFDLGIKHIIVAGHFWPDKYPQVYKIEPEKSI